MTTMRGPAGLLTVLIAMAACSDGGKAGAAGDPGIGGGGGAGRGGNGGSGNGGAGNGGSGNGGAGNGGAGNGGSGHGGAGNGGAGNGGAGGGPDPAQCGQPVTTDGVLDLDLTTVRVTGRVTLDGRPLPASTARPVLRLQRADTAEGGAFVDLDRGDTFDVRVVPGRYFVLYDRARCADAIYPCQQGAALGEARLEADGNYDVDLRTARVTGRVTVAGAALPSGASGAIRLGTADSAGTLADLSAADGAYEARVLVGTYDVLYDRPAGDCTGALPCQNMVPLRRGVTLSTDGVLDVDVPTVRVRGRVTLDGGPWPVTGDGGRIRVRQGASISQLAELDTGDSYDARLVPGTYDLVYEGPRACAGDVLPCQDGVVIRAGVATGADGVLDLDVRTVRVRGQVTANGAPLPANDARGLLRVRGQDGSVGILSDLDALAAGTYAARLVAGTYELLYDVPEARCTGQAMPCQQLTPFSSLAATANGVFDIDLPLVRLRGRVTLDGAPLPASPYGRGDLVLSRADGARGLLARLDALGPAGYDAVLLRGSYEVLYAQRSSACTGTPFPCQVDHVLTSLPASADGVFDVDLDTVRLQGRLTVNGGAFPGGDAAIRLRGPRGSTGTLADLSTATTWDVRLLPARYDLVYTPDPRCDGASLPCQSAVLRGCPPP